MTPVGYLITWSIISLITTLIRAIVLNKEDEYTSVIWERPLWGHYTNLTQFGNLCAYVVDLIGELVFTPYILLRWVVVKILFKTVKAVFIKGK